jgi:hypothetical protein
MRTEEIVRQSADFKPPRFVVIDRTMLISAIACNTDASPPDAAGIVNTVLYKQNGGDPNDYRDINEGMYSDRCDDNLALCAALREVFALAGEDKRIGQIVEVAIREHGL